MEKDIPCNADEKKAGVAILISDRPEFRPGEIIGNKQGITYVVEVSSPRRRNKP